MNCNFSGKKSKVVFFIGAMSKGGGERQLVYVANGMLKKGWEVEVVTMKEGDAYLRYLDDNVSINCLNVGGGLSAFAKSLLYFSSNRPGVIICFLFHATLVGRLAGFLLRIPVISSYRNVSYGSKLRNALMRWTGRFDIKTLSNVSAAGDTLLPKKLRKYLQVVPNIYYENAIPTGVVNMPEKKSFRWCYVGRLEEQKNLEELFVAFRNFLTVSEEDCHLLILGEGKKMASLEKMVNDLKINGSVFFLGHSYFVKSVLEKCDAFILPSKHEGMPNALMEAMAIKVPAVVTPVGAIPDMIKNGESGIVAEGVDAENLCSAMLKMYRMSDAQRSEIADNAYYYIASNCNEAVVIERWEREISEVVS